MTNEFRQELIDRFRHLMRGDYCRHYQLEPVDCCAGLELTHPLSKLNALVNHVLLEQFSTEEMEGLQCLVRPSFGTVRTGAMMVALDKTNGLIRLIIDPSYLCAILDAAESLRLPQYVVQTELRWLLRHELWHVLLGHNYIPLQYTNHPLCQIAIETAVNDGALRISELRPAYPFLCLSRIGLLLQAQEIAQQLALPPDWLCDFRDVLRVLEQLQALQVLEAWLEQDEQGEPVLVIRNHALGYTYRFERYAHGDIQQVESQDEVDGFLRDLIPHLSNRFQYDPLRTRYRYSPEDYAPGERIIRPRALHLPWHKIASLLESDRRSGFDRRRYHLYPRDQQPLISRQRRKQGEILVYIDSSGSVSDELISTFIGIASRSPYRTRIFYFSTTVKDHPHTGGTDYGCILSHLQQRLESGYPIPRAVLVFTDGCAEPIQVPWPERWYWIVVGDDSVPRHCGGRILKAIESIG